MVTIKDLFDKVLELKGGDVIVLNFVTEKDMLSKAVMLQRERKRYDEQLGEQSVFIHKETDRKKGVFRIHLSSSGSVLDWIQNAVIKSPDGKTRALEMTGKNDNFECRIKMLTEAQNEKSEDRPGALE